MNKLELIQALKDAKDLTKPEATTRGGERVKIKTEEAAVL